jgi:hypothetical protein
MVAAVTEIELSKNASPTCGLSWYAARFPTIVMMSPSFRPRVLKSSIPYT